MPVHSREFCPGATCGIHVKATFADTAAYRSHKRAAAVRKRVLKACGDCGGPRPLNLYGDRHGVRVRLCADCKEKAWTGRPPVHLSRAYRQAVPA